MQVAPAPQPTGPSPQPAAAHAASLATNHLRKQPPRDSMRGIVLIALVGLMAQSMAEAPQQAVYAPAVEAKPTELPSGYSVQTGYEGYLVPAHDTKTELTEDQGGLLTNFFSNLLSGAPVDAIASLLGATGLENIIEDNKITVVGAGGKPVVIPLPLGPKGSLKGKKHLKKVLVAKVITKLVLNVVGFALLFLVVAGVGASVCAFTPFCAITFPVAREMRSYATADNLNKLSAFVANAMDKYQRFQ